MERELPISPWQEWEIVEKIGEGAYGRVYKAKRTEHGHSFYSAIKIISIPSGKEELDSVFRETQSEQVTRDYFENLMEDCIQEISTMEFFRGNSYIVSVEDFKVVEYLDEIGWDIYIRMEYLTSFTEACAGKEFGVEEVLDLGIDLSRALCYCRERNIIHRDIKPENIFVSRFGDYKLGDFGIAREAAMDQHSFSKKGTYSYMAPEMYKGEEYDDRADLYSLGLVLYKLLNHNRLPFMDLNKQLITYHDKENALTRRMTGEALPPPAEAPESFAKVLSKVCAYKKENRYRTAGEFLEALLELKREKDFRSKLHQEESRNEGVPETKKTRESETEKISLDQKAKQQTSSERDTADTDVGQHEEKGALKSGKDTADIDVSRSGENSSSKISGIVRSIAPWLIVVILVAAAAVMITGAYMKKMLQDTLELQTEQMVSQVQDQSVVEETPDSGTFAEDIASISERVTAIVDETEEYQVSGSEGQSLRYYDADGLLKKVLVYPQMSREGMYEEYYYWNQNLIFAYIWKDDLVDMYYYQDGILIRWIDRDGVTHDNEQTNEEYVLNGDRYWSQSVEYLTGGAYEE